MKTRKVFGKIALFLTIAMLMTSLFVPTAYAYPYLSTNPVPVYGRLLTPDKTGDSSNWIEVAQNGPYSLIVRQKYISWRPNYPGYEQYYNDPRYQSYAYGAPSNGLWIGNIAASAVYARSYPRDIINNWFNDRVNKISGNQKGADSLPPTARIRNYTMYNNALQVLGTNCKEDSFRDGFSAPSPVKTGYGDDVAFALSSTEASNFISTGADIRSSEGYRMSNPYAQMNYKRLNIPLFIYKQNNGYTGMWLRTPGDCKDTAGSLTSGRDDLDRRYDGRVFQMGTGGASYWNMCTYPALWVDSAIFDVNYPITVNYYKDSISSANFLRNDSLTPLPVGTAIDVDLTKYAPAGYTVPGEREGATHVNPGENVVNVIYKKPVQKSTVYVYYYKDAVGGDFLGMDIAYDAPVGVPVAPYINAAKYTPPGYQTAGTIIGDSQTVAGNTVIMYIFDKPAALKNVYVLHMVQMFQGNYTAFGYDSMDVFQAAEGDVINSMTKMKFIPGYMYFDAIPPVIQVGEYNTIIIRYLMY